MFALLAGEVVAVDSWEGPQPKAALLEFRHMAARYPNVTAVRARSPQAAGLFPDRHFDLVYIDADHTYEAVRTDIRAWLPKVREGGWIAGHDYTHELGLGGVIRAVDELLGRPEQVFSDASWVARPLGGVRSQIEVVSAPAITLSVIVPTVGRPALARALASIAAQGDLTGVEVIVAVDGDHPEGHQIFQASGLPGYSVGLRGPHRDWGHSPTNLVTPLTRHAYLMRLDDDNIYTPGAFAAIRAAVAENPGQPNVFRVRQGPPSGDVLWASPGLRPGNVDSQMFVVPNDPTHLGRWGSRYEGDFDFLVETAALYPPEAIVWREEIIGTWRPGEPEDSSSVGQTNAGHTVGCEQQ